MTICTRFDICSSDKVNSGEMCPNRVVSFGLNRAKVKCEHPTRVVQITLNILDISMDFGDL